MPRSDKNYVRVIEHVFFHIRGGIFSGDETLCMFDFGKHFRFVMCTLKFGSRPSPRLCIAMCAGVVFWTTVSFIMVPLMENQFRFLRRVGSLAAVLRISVVNSNNHVESY